MTLCWSRHQYVNWCATSGRRPIGMPPSRLPGLSMYLAVSSSTTLNAPYHWPARTILKSSAFTPIAPRATGFGSKRACRAIRKKKGIVEAGVHYAAGIPAAAGVSKPGERQPAIGGMVLGKPANRCHAGTTREKPLTRFPATERARRNPARGPTGAGGVGPGQGASRRPRPVRALLIPSLPLGRL